MGEAIQLYWKPTCVGCRRARWFLQDLGVAFDERDVIKNPLTLEELDKLIGGANPVDFLSPKNPKVKAKGYIQNPPPRAELLSLLAADANLLRRPIVTVGAKLVVGWDEKQLKALLA
ncbi:MAG: hypothetical protein HYZ53_21970 [Planctomycetes bacterium]|nr:hypothetical protein [Planctomycetota bacterium]